MDTEPLEYWNSQARNYDDNIFSTIDEDYTGIITRMIERFAQPDEEGPMGECIDLGCGAGKYLPKLGKDFRKVVGYDLSPKLVALSKKEVQKHGLTNVEVAVRDLSQVWYRDDGAAACVFGHKDEMERFGFAVMANVLIAPITDGLRGVMLKNAYRSLCPGGHLLVVVPSLESALYVNMRCDEVDYDGPYTVGAGGSRPSRDEGADLVKGVLKRSGVRTKHFLEPEFCCLANKAGFSVEFCEKVLFNWHSELGLSSDISVPPALKELPLPWDWLFILRKIPQEELLSKYTQRNRPPVLPANRPDRARSLQSERNLHLAGRESGPETSASAGSRYANSKWGTPRAGSSASNCDGDEGKLLPELALPIFAGGTKPGLLQGDVSVEAV
eukprot:TRINITY_DN37247_c0_g1_i1.p1 TRINITY_DN37247_c0_g1~~TRINITY_DN37247_c0_g1_i1.p1  ORF type:complete len:426 (+),score=66.31 TRINITY_DN37247_c0_g1_i1:126-1280(+)